ncbi:hypothetical protein FN846DRAFT_915254 [Sphaerosporella brunnea]|uniref:Uncharacterized protein n=1 Tax=Sphaerosporella brunnea TaxID=1250544 RepID=A0A5J5EBJ2_9PEZI|nr:hypothetical protein FN846DRAFT_915254 [Sphaerosporella brunnea]
MRKAHELESLGFTAAPEERLDATFEELQQSKKESRLSKLEDNYLTELTVAYDKVKELIAKLDKSTGAVGHAEAKPEKSIEQSQAAKQDAAELRARNNELEQEHGELQSRYDQLQKENIELQTRCGRLHVGNELLKDRFDGLQAQYQRGTKCGIELEEMWKELKQNNDALRSRYEQLEKNATELQEDYSRLRIDNGELQNLYSTLSIQFTAGVKCGAELQGRWAKVQAEKNHLQERYDELEQAKVKLENRHIKLKTFNAELRKSNDELKQRCGQLDRRWEECCLQVNKTKQQISKCEDRSRTLSLALADMTRREREAKQAQVTTESRMRDQLAALEQAGALEVSDLKKEIARLNCVLTEKQDHTERLEQIAYSTHFELSETEKAVAEAKHAEQQAMNALTAEEEKVCSLQARYNELQKQAEASHELIHNFFEPHVGAITAANCDMSEKLHIVERAWAEASLTVEEYENEIALLHKQIAAGLSRENLWKQKVDVLAPKNEAPIANVLEFMKAHKNTEVSADSSVIAQTTLEEMEEEIIESAEQITEGAEDLDGLRFLDEDEEEDEEEEEEYEAEEEAEEGEYEEKEEEEESQFELVEVP